VDRLPRFTEKGKPLRDYPCLLVTCCTGLYAPGVGTFEIVGPTLGAFRRGVEAHDGLDFMGCYAAINALEALARATLFAQIRRRVFLMVPTWELCARCHFQETQELEQVAFRFLVFADGGGGRGLDYRNAKARGFAAGTASRR